MGKVLGFVVFTLTASIQMSDQAIANVAVQRTKRLTGIAKAIVLTPALQVEIEVLYEVRGGHEATLRPGFLMNHVPSFLQGFLGRA